MTTRTAADHITTTLSQALTRVLAELTLASIDDVTLGPLSSPLASVPFPLAARELVVSFLGRPTVRVQLIAPNNRECIVIVTLPYVLTHAPVCVARSTVPLNGTGLDRHDLVAAAVETLIEMALRHAGDPQTCAELVARTGLRFGLVSNTLGRMLTAGKLRHLIIAPLTSVYLLAETP
jgi:hypothetical protein